MLEAVPFPSPTLERSDEAAKSKSDLLIVGLAEETELPATLRTVDETIGGRVRSLISQGAITGKAGETTQIINPADEGAASILVQGLGSPASFTRGTAFDAAATAIRKAGDRPRAHVEIALAECFEDTFADAVVAGAVFGCEGQAIYRSEPELHVAERMTFLKVTSADIERGKIIGDSINHTRRLVNEPAATIYPQSFAERADALLAEVGVETEVWDESKLEAEGCRAILAVGGGSCRPPRLAMMRYRGGGDAPWLALVGKGVTFDSGGLSIKPSDGMTTMKCDMAGAATVVGVVRAIAALGLKINVLGLCGLAENMLSGSSYKLGDVIETRSGKTIEILNTDAEGRVVLADVLDVAVQHRPAAIVDLATLTGACMVALGTEVTGMMTNNQDLCEAVQRAARHQGEPVWQLPMFELYNEKVKSKVADIKNVGEGRWAGAITAAKFLENFVDDVSWLHLDIAGPAFAESPKPHRDAGATGVMVRTLVRWLESQQG